MARGGAERCAGGAEPARDRAVKGRGWFLFPYPLGSVGLDGLLAPGPSPPCLQLLRNLQWFLRGQILPDRCLSLAMRPEWGLAHPSSFTSSGHSNQAMVYGVEVRTVTSMPEKAALFLRGPTVKVKGNYYNMLES